MKDTRNRLGDRILLLLFTSSVKRIRLYFYPFRELIFHLSFYEEEVQKKPGRIDRGNVKVAYGEAIESVRRFYQMENELDDCWGLGYFKIKSNRWKDTLYGSSSLYKFSVLVVSRKFKLYQKENVLNHYETYLNLECRLSSSIC